MAYAAAAPRSHAAAESSGLMVGTAKLLVTAAVWLCASLLFSIVIEWIGMVWFWPEEGAQHSYDLLRAELAHLNGGDARPVLGIDAKAIVERNATWTYETVWQRSGAIGVIDRLNGQVQEFAVALVNITLVFTTRVSILALSMPTFAVFGLVGLADGLIERDLRRWGGGRESGYVFHLAVRYIKPALIGAWVVYLSLPVSVSPFLVVVPFAVLFALAARISAASFKKYL